jgi:CelD/BcsL family acetyltransferase involved in cellulose biosynthesis
MTELQLETITDLAGLEAAAPGWDELVASQRRPSPFLLHGWLVEWVRHFGAGAELRIQVARRDGRLVGALPLQVVRRRGLRVAEFVGGSLTNFADLLLLPGELPETAAALLRVGGPRYDYAHLHGLSGGSRLAASTDLRTIERVGAPVLDLSPGWDAVYAAKTSSKKRNLHRRRRKQLDALGRIEKRIARTQAEIDAVLDDTFRLHELRWAGRHDGSGYATPEGRVFHRAAALRLAADDFVRIVSLDLDGVPIAFHYYFALAGRMYVHRLAFDPAYAQASPGLVNTLDALETAGNEALNLVEYMGSADRYKVELSDRLDPMHDAFGLAATPQGRVAAAATRATLDLRLRTKQVDALRNAYLRARALTVR